MNLRLAKCELGPSLVFCLKIVIFNPQAPVARKIADEVVFRPFQGEGVEFLQVGSH